MTDSNERLEPRHGQPHRGREEASGKLSQLLSKIESTRSNFRSVLSSIARRQPHQPNASSEDISQIDFKEELEKLQQSNDIEEPPTCPDIVSKTIQDINSREIRTARRVPIKATPKEPRSPKSSPAITNKKPADPELQDRLPSPRQRPLLKLGRSSQPKKEASAEVDPLRKSYLEIDLKNFKKTANGTLVRVQPLGVEQQIQHRIQEVKPRSNEAVIVNIATGPQVRSTSLKPCKLETVDEQLIFGYVRDHGLLESTASANIIYDYFHGLTQLLRLSFEAPLIKKYKNCVYYGENPQGKAAYEGVLYHYKNKLYFGSFKEGRKHGRGCEINYKEGTVCRGQYQNGAKIGVFKVKSDEYEYEGGLVDGLFEGAGTLLNKYSKYAGQFDKGYKHGRGEEIFFHSGERYSGFYDRGSFDGIGEISSKNYLYQGNFQNNLKHGTGYEKTVQDEYRGQFAEGKRNGKGSVYLSNGDSYTGQFKDGQMYGRGEYQYSDGQSVQGYFVNGRMISEKNSVTAAPFRSSRKQAGHTHLFQIQENDDQFQGLDYAETRKEWHQPPHMRDFPRNPQEQRIKHTSRAVFNPEKLLRLGKGDDRNNFFTPEPTTRRMEEESSGVPRRNSDFERPFLADPRLGMETQRYHSNERRQRGNEVSSTYGHQKSSNNFIQMDYSLFDNSIDEEAPSFPLISHTRLKSGHTDQPIQKRFG